MAVNRMTQGEPWYVNGMMVNISETQIPYFDQKGLYIYILNFPSLFSGVN